MEDRIVGNFKIIRELGRGGMGIVYLAEDLRLQRKVALKFLREEKVNRDKIISEARLASQLNHPGVVTIYDVVEADEGVFIVMEYVEGEPLSRFLEVHRIDPPLALRLAKQICEIVSFAHQHHLIHGDLKPNNIIITPEGKPKLLDFGLSSLYSNQQEISFVAGTFPYLAPEQILGSNIDEKTDIYALGIIFYQIFTGKLPFQKYHQAAQIYATMHEIPKPPHELKKNISPVLSKIILRCLSKEPLKRYNSTKALYRDLDTVVIETTREKKKSYINWILAGILSLIIIGIGGFLYIQHRENTKPIYVNSLAEISLPEDTRLYVRFRTNLETDMNLQMHLFSLSEILQEQLKQIANLEFISENTFLQSSSNWNGPEKQFDYEVQIELIRTKENFRIRYRLTNNQNRGTEKDEIAWKSFEDILWIGPRLLSRIVKFITNQNLILQKLPSELEKNITAYRYLAQGVYHFNEKNYQMANINFKKALGINPFFTRAHYFYGLALLEQNQYEKAIEELNNALPNTNKKSLIDWEVPLNSSGRVIYIFKPIDLLQRDRLIPQEHFFVAFRNQSDSILFIDPSLKQIQTLFFPEISEKFQVLSVNHYGKFFCFVLFLKKSRRFCLLSYNPSSHKWQIGQSFPPQKIYFFKNLALFFDESNHLILTNLNELNRGTIFQKPSDKQSQFKIHFIDNEIFVFNDSLFYRADLDKNKLTQINITSLKGKKIINCISKYMVYIDSQKNLLGIYDILNNKKIADISLIKSKSFRLHRGLPYLIDLDNEAIFTIQPDTFIYKYQFDDKNHLHVVGKYSIHNFPNQFILTDQVEPEPHINNDVFIDYYSGEVFIPDQDNNGLLKRIWINKKIKEIPKNTKNYVIIHTTEGFSIIRKKDAKIVAKLKGNYNYTYVLPEKNLLIYSDGARNRLNFYQYSNQRFIGYYQFESQGQTDIKVYQDYIYFIENGTFKQLNINKLLNQNPIHLANIHQKIAESYYQLNQLEKSKIYIDKILSNFQPNKVESLELLIKIALKQNDYEIIIENLPLIYKFLPENHPDKAKIEYSLKDSQLYEWAINVPLLEGNRFMEITEDHILFTDANSFRIDSLWYINLFNGQVSWKYPYQYRFSCCLAQPGMLFFTQSHAPNKYPSYFLLDLNKKNILKKIQTSNQTTTLQKLRIRKIDEFKFIAHYKYAELDKWNIDLIDIQNRKIEPIFESKEFISEPFIKNNTLYIVRNDSLFSYNPQHKQWTVSDIKTLQKMNIPVLEILSISTHRMYVRGLTNKIYQHNLANNQVKIMPHYSKPLSHFAYSQTSGELITFTSDSVYCFKIRPSLSIVDVNQVGNILYVLESNRLSIYKNGEIIKSFPLLWTGTKLKIKGDKAFILSIDGKLYCLNMKWVPEKLKKDLIFTTN